MATILSTVYASRPVDNMVFSTLEINIPDVDPVRMVADYFDHEFGVDGVNQLFKASPLSIGLPNKNNSGQQVIRFGFAFRGAEVQRMIDKALDSDTPSTMTYREYLLSDKSAPAKRPYVMTIIGGRIEGAEVVFEGSYYDLINSAWPRQHYTTLNAPGVKYL